MSLFPNLEVASKYAAFIFTSSGPVSVLIRIMSLGSPLRTFFVNSNMTMRRDMLPELSTHRGSSFPASMPWLFQSKLSMAVSFFTGMLIDSPVIMLCSCAWSRSRSALISGPMYASLFRNADSPNFFSMLLDSTPMRSLP